MACKKNKKITPENIPAATQLFTPHWIVRYLVENSLGRLWLLNRPGSRLVEQMHYYIEPASSRRPTSSRSAKPEEIKLCDPACGSGHMLTYAFDLLYAIYEEEGYAPTEIPGLILRHNLYGLEICPRAAQLAELALVFKAREKSRRFFQPEHLVRPHIIELHDVRFAENELRDYIQRPRAGRPLSTSPCSSCSTSSRRRRTSARSSSRASTNGPSPIARTRHRGEGPRRPALPARDAPQSPARARTSRGAHPAVSRRRGQSAALIIVPATPVTPPPAGAQAAWAGAVVGARWRGQRLLR